MNMYSIDPLIGYPCLLNREEEEEKEKKSLRKPKRNFHGKSRKTLFLRLPPDGKASFVLLSPRVSF